MNKINKKYKIKIFGANYRISKMLGLCRQKIKDLIYIDEKKLKNFLSVGIILFLGIFMSCVVISSKQIVRASDNIKTTSIGKRQHRNIKLENQIKKITAGYPIEKMTYYISRENVKVAAFMVAIAKKESNWGKRTPKLKGKECYNYWGFRKRRKRMGSGGHTCFDNPKDAVESVSGRIKHFIAEGINTPQKMVIWKCGYSCKSQNPQSVKKWIADVKLYYNEF